MKTWLVNIVLCLVTIILASSITPPKAADESSERISAYLKKMEGEFASGAMELETSVAQLNPNSNISIARTKKALAHCRLQYKRISFLLDYFFPSESVVFNAPSKYEVDEPDMEYQHPSGLQVIESLLYDTNLGNNKKSMLRQASLVRRSADELSTLLYNFKATDAQLLESSRIELIRIMTLYITGYDAPLLKSGLQEAIASLIAMRTLMDPYLAAYAEKDSVIANMQSCIQFLKAARGFDQFDRLHFLTAYALPLQFKLNKMSQALNLHLNTVPALNNGSQNLFSPDALSKDAFSTTVSNDAAMILLGKQLFSEKALSGNHALSCASCHIPGKYFQDRRDRTRSPGTHNNLPRNTPGLLYSTYQYSQFWDGRAKDLNEQALLVLHNKEEMNSRDDTVENRLQLSAEYRAVFKKIWPGQAKPVNMQNLTAAISTYIGSLSPFRSAFDRYMQGDTTALTNTQRKGFNLFMGKAACGTCHFAPVFNGLTPPFYNKTEYEILGTTLTDDLKRPVKDKDRGRYDFFPIKFYRKAFKTPTIRNAAMTAPFMHNGGFKSLETVIDFYDQGGGAGIGMKEESQTLSPIPLHLSPGEKAAIIAFLNSLTDDKKSVR